MGSHRKLITPAMHGLGFISTSMYKIPMTKLKKNNTGTTTTARLLVLHDIVLLSSSMKSYYIEACNINLQLDICTISKLASGNVLKCYVSCESKLKNQNPKKKSKIIKNVQKKG